LLADGDFVFVSQGNNREVGCFRSADGRRIWWVHDFLNDKVETYAVPVIFEDRVFLLFSNGDLNIFARRSGKWLTEPKNLAQDYDARAPLNGYASAPLLCDGKLILNPGAQGASLVALDPQTLKEVWRSPGRRTSRSYFITGTFGGVKQIVGFDHDSLGGWAPDTGKRLWMLDTPDRTEDAGEALFESNGQLLVSTSNRATALYRFGANGVIEEKPAAVNPKPRGQIHALSRRLAIGIGDGLCCLNLDDELKEGWHFTEDTLPHAWFALVDASQQLWIFTSDGTLHVMKFSASKVGVLASWKLCDAITAYPALTADRLFVRSNTALLAFDAKALAAPRP
jgi:outer membrane protein assembly factor BamB